MIQLTSRKYLRLIVRFIYLLCPLFIAPKTSWAKTAETIFEEASNSVVVVQTYNKKGSALSQGSGVVVEENTVATNCHVLNGAATIKIKHNGDYFNSSVRSTNWEKDVCLLTSDRLDAVAAKIGKTAAAKIGQKIYTIGAPRGLELTLSDGIISGLRESGEGRYIQISAPISPGSSGGGLFDSVGRLIGLPTFYLSNGQQLNFALPIEWVLAELKNSRITTRKTIDFSSRFTTAAQLDDAKDWHGLRKHASNWVRNHPSEFIGWFFLGFANYKLGHNSDALKSMETVLRLNPNAAAALGLTGLIKIEMNDWSGAEIALIDATTLTPNDAERWADLGYLYHRKGDYQMSIDTLLTSLKLDPESEKVWKLLGTSYARLGMLENSISAYKEFLRIKPNDPQVWKMIGLSHQMKKNHQPAIDAYQEVLKSNPNDIEIYRLLAASYRGLHNTHLAIENYKKAISMNPEDLDTWIMLGYTYKAAGMNREVVTTYENLKSFNPKGAAEFFRKLLL